MDQASNDVATIRRATVEDAEAVAKIYNHYVDQGGATFETEHWSKAGAIKRVLSDRPDTWLVAESADHLVGWASARRYSQRSGYKHTCETAIYLDASAFGLGVGDALQRAIDEHCRQHQIHHAVAKIIAGNQHSTAFHRRHGFELVGVQREIGRVDGRWVDVSIMQKIYR